MQRTTVGRLLAVAVAAGMLVTLATPVSAAGSEIDYLGATGFSCVDHHVDFKAADDAGRARALDLFVYPDGGEPFYVGSAEGRGLLSVQDYVTVTPGDHWWLSADLYAYNVKTGARGKLIDTATYEFWLTCSA